MSVRAFVGFDLGRDTSTVSAYPGTNWTNNLNAYIAWAKPVYVTHNSGVSPWNSDAQPANASGNQNFHFFTRPSNAGMAYGHASNGGNFSGRYTGATTMTRAAWRTAKGHQLALSRSRVIPALTNTELWFTFDISFPSLGGSSIASGLSADSYGAMWKWGDLSVYVKSTTWISGTTHDIVFSVRNGASEVATVTVPSVVTNDTFASAAALFVTIQAKLDATTGMIAVAINGNAQSVAYTGQNTVATTSDAAASEIYFGPPVIDDGTNVYVGMIDHFLVDDAAFPAGRPTVRLITLNADVSLSGVAAAGTSPTTVANALTGPTDAKQARWSTTTGSAEMSMTMPSTTGMLSDVLGFEVIAQRAANRYPTAALKLRVGMKLSGVEAEDEYCQVQSLAFSSILTPPETAATSPCAQIWEKGGGGKFQTTDLASTTILLTSQT